MKLVLASVLSTMALSAAPAMACDVQSANYWGHSLWQALSQFSQVAQNDPQFSWAGYSAFNLGNLAHHIGDHAEQNQCPDAQNDFFSELAPQYSQLDSQIDPRIGYANSYTASAWHNVENAYQQLQAAFYR